MLSWVKPRYIGLWQARAKTRKQSNTSSNNRSNKKDTGETYRSGRQKQVPDTGIELTDKRNTNTEAREPQHEAHGN